MGIGEFRILGISGGAPYALAAAWAMPERVRAIAVVSSAPPITDLTGSQWIAPTLSLAALFLSTSSRAAALLVSRRASVSFRESSGSIPAASSQAAPTLRCQCHARHRRLRGLLRKSAPGLARLGRRSDDRRRNLRESVGIYARGNSRAGSALARKKRPELSLVDWPDR